METKELYNRLDGVRLSYDDYCALAEWLGYPDTQDCGMSGQYPGYHWEIFKIDDCEIDVYWI